MTEEKKPARKPRRPATETIPDKLLNLKTQTEVVASLVALDREAAEMLKAKLERALKPRGGM